MLLSRMLVKKYHLSPENVTALLEGLRSEDLLDLGEYMLDCEPFDDIWHWIAQCKQGNLS